MYRNLLFSSFDAFREVPRNCSLCLDRAPVLHFTLHEIRPEDREPIKGFCCAPCAAHLIAKLEQGESWDWTEQEATLAGDGIDTSNLRHRLESLRAALTR